MKADLRNRFDVDVTLPQKISKTIKTLKQTNNDAYEKITFADFVQFELILVSIGIARDKKIKTSN